MKYDPNLFCVCNQPTVPNPHPLKSHESASHLPTRRMAMPTGPLSSNWELLRKRLDAAAPPKRKPAVVAAVEKEEPAKKKLKRRR